jgi:hypothetical protein
LVSPPLSYSFFIIFIIYFMHDYLVFFLVVGGFR